jgi:hypothetical protein
MTEQDRGNFETIIETFGKEAQMVVAIEELAELQQEITKKLRHKKGTVFGLVEEIADVEIMTDQLKVMFGIGEKELATERNYKINRTLEKIRKAKEKKSK